MSERLERVKMCMAEAGFVEGRDYGGLYLDDENPLIIHMWGWHYIHDLTVMDPVLKRAADLVRQFEENPVG